MGALCSAVRRLCCCCCCKEGGNDDARRYNWRHTYAFDDGRVTAFSNPVYQQANSDGSPAQLYEPPPAFADVDSVVEFSLTQSF